MIWLPAGEVYLAPVIGSANGIVIVDRHFYQGNLITNLKLTFKNGKLLTGGSISLQSESHPVEFRKVELLQLKN